MRRKRRGRRRFLNGSSYLTPSQPQGSYHGETQKVSNLQAKIPITFLDEQVEKEKEEEEEEKKEEEEEDDDDDDDQLVSQLVL